MPRSYGNLAGPIGANALIAVLFAQGSAGAHPASGIVVDPSGSVYFSDLSRGLVRIDTRGNVTPVHKEGFHWIALDANGLFSRVDFDKDMPRWLKRRSAYGIVPAVITASDSPVVVGHDGNLYYVCDDEGLNPGVLQIARLAPDGKRTLLNPELRRMSQQLGGIKDLATGPDGSLYASYGRAVLRITPAGTISTVLNPAVLPDCEKTPPSISDAPSLRGLAVDERGTVYVAATGCRRVISIGPDGRAAVVVRSEAPWSASGVAIHNGSIYVLEHVNANSESHDVWPPRVRKIAPDGSTKTLIEFRE